MHGFTIFLFFNGEILLDFFLSKLSDYLEETYDVVIYIDSHGTENSSGIATKKNAFLGWQRLINGLKIAFAKFQKKPTLILTACNGIGIKKFIDQLEEPIISKLIAGMGIMRDGPVLSAFRKTFETKGLEIEAADVRDINIILKERYEDHPAFEYIEY